MLLNRLCSVVLIGTTFAIVGCASKPVVQQSRKVVYVPEFYTVQPGESLSSIGAKFNLNYMDIAAMNQIQTIDKIYVNQSLRLRPSDRSVTTSSVQTKPIEQNFEIKRQTVQVSPPVNRANTSNNPARVPAANKVINTVPVVKPVVPNIAVSNIATPVVSNGLQWSMPTKGTIIQHFDAAQNFKGLRFAGKEGDPVYASAAGKVVYADDGLPEYGKLILIEHANGYLTVYAHNSALLVKVGDTVKGGQQIAAMGSTGTTKVMLEFQVRLNSKPIDPKIVLPIN